MGRKSMSYRYWGQNYSGALLSNYAELRPLLLAMPKLRAINAAMKALTRGVLAQFSPHLSPFL